ncbi:MAG: hypothetical protein GXP47_14595 [Acidobacteria bacterium]|nr:hypothetical protein [Acidobacteriota bacterium]
MGWLLDDDHPTVGWKVLTDLIRRPAEAPAVNRARGAANASEPLATMLASLDPAGRWNVQEGAWNGPEGGGWRVVAAVQLGADPQDPRLDAAARRLATAPVPADPAFPCVAARAAEALALLGWGNSPELTELLAWLDEGAPPAEDGGWRCGHPSHAGPGGGCVVTPTAILAALAAPGARHRPALAVRARDALLDLLGEEPEPSMPEGWPNLLRSSKVEILMRLALAGVPWDPRMNATLKELQASQDSLGRWIADAEPEATWSGAPGLDRPGSPSRWLTLHALIALRAYAVPAGLPRFYPERPAASN